MRQHLPARVLAFAAEHGEGRMPLSALIFLRYVNHTASGCEERGLTRSTIFTACSATMFFHDLAGMDDPTANSVVRMLKQAVGRILGTGGKQQAALTGADMEQLYGTYAARGEQELLMLMQIAAMKAGRTFAVG